MTRRLIGVRCSKGEYRCANDAAFQVATNWGDYRGAPATAVIVRELVKLVFAYASMHGEKAPNPADEVGPSSIATFVPKDRALSPSEIRLMHRLLETTATLPTISLDLRLVILTLVRKSELIEAP